MAEDAQQALDTLKRILDAQETALKRQAKELDRLQERESELSERVETLAQQAEEASERARTLEEEAEQSFQSREISRLQMAESELSGHILKLNRRAEETNERIRELEQAVDRQARDNEALEERADGLARELASTTERLTAQANAAEQQVQLLEDRCRSLKEKADYGERMRFVGEKLEGATERARELEVRCNALQVKADDYDDLVAAARKLVTSLAKLPLDMKDAAMVPNAVRPKIELYGTYDWQQAMDAKLALEAELRKGA